MVLQAQGVTQENTAQITKLLENNIENGIGKTALGTYQSSSSKGSQGTKGPNKRTNQSSFSSKATKEKIKNSRTNQSSCTRDPGNYQSSYPMIPENHIEIDSNSRASQSSDTIEIKENIGMKCKTDQYSSTADPRIYQSSFLMAPENLINIETKSSTNQSSKTNQSTYTTDLRSYQSSCPRVPENTMEMDLNSRASQSSDTIGVNEGTIMNERTDQSSPTTDPRTYQSSVLRTYTNQSSNAMGTRELGSQKEKEANKSQQRCIVTDTNMGNNKQVLKYKNNKDYQRSKKTEQTNRIQYQPFKKNIISYDTPKNKRPVRPIKLFREINDRHLTYKERNMKFKINEDIEDMNLQVILMNTQTITASKFQEMVKHA